MIELSEFESLLHGVVRACPVRISLWDGDGSLLLLSDRDGNGSTPAEGLREFVDKARNRTEFYQAFCEDGVWRFSMPVFCDKGLAMLLVTSWLGDTDPAPDDMRDLLQSLIGTVVSRQRADEEIVDLAGELDRCFEDLHLYSNIATQIRALRLTAFTLQNLIEEILKNMRADLAFAHFPERPDLDVEITREGADTSIDNLHDWMNQLLQAMPSNAATLEDNYYIVNDSRTEAGYRDLSEEAFRFLAVRIQYEEESYGWLSLVSFNMEEIFRQGELQLLVSMAEQVAIVIANSDLYSDLERFIISIVRSLVFAIEAKDVYTRGHSERVSRFSILLGDRLSLSPEEKMNLQWASILHDIGKIGIPEKILNKPDRLDDEEFAAIKGHPEKGVNILKPIEQLSDALPGILHHHERFDGAGYPFGLKGEKIPLIARVIAVADAYDAMGSSRAYRQAYDTEKVMSIIDEVSGSQLDPDLVPHFKGLYKDGLLVIGSVAEAG